MRVRDLIKMFGYLQDVEIYPVINEKYPDEFMFVDVEEDKPLYRGRFNDMPAYLVNLKICEDPEVLDGGPMVETRALGNGGSLVFMVEENQEAY